MMLLTKLSQLYYWTPKIAVNSRSSHLVSYTIYFAKTGPGYQYILDRHIRSVESLRRNNRSIPVYLGVWGGKLRTRDQHYLEKLRVEIRHLGSYEKHLRRNLPSKWATVFAQYPLGQKWLSLDQILTKRFDRVLHIDNDTFILCDIEELFEKFQQADFCAREEPTTKRRHIAYDPTYIDESIISSLQHSEKVNRIIPFNTGVVLMKREVTEWLSRNLDLYLCYLMRFTIWLVKQTGTIADEPFLCAARRLNVAAASSRLWPLVYPSSNQWILDEFALWFTLATSKFKIRFFPLSAVLQGDEFPEIGTQWRAPRLIHYYSANADYFFDNWLPGVERSCIGK